MRYNVLVKNSDKLSVLGFGCMRFPMKSGRADISAANELLSAAYKNGINYFDTAYFYHSGKSEEILGNFIKEMGIRDKVYIADKLPCFLVKKAEQIPNFFDTQLKRLSTNYIDYYLMHTLDSNTQWQGLKALGIENFLKEKKNSGEIRHVGFSFHGRPEEFIKILEDYPWDFCQIQYNYLDENYQAGVRGLKRAYELGIGVVVMEPLRGGKLAGKVPLKVSDEINSYHEKRSAASWAFRWLFNQKEVSVVLSGMNELSQLDENCNTVNNSSPDCMSEEELIVIDKIKTVYKSLMKTPCTGCNYCMPCPFGVDIPGCFSDYNASSLFGGRLPTMHYLMRVEGGMGAGKSGANLCTECGKCLSHCPQHIDIPNELKIAHKSLDKVILRFGIRMALILTGRRKTVKKQNI